MKKTIGILGGMGPYATVSFVKKILDLTYAEKDWDYPRLIIDNHSQIPSRTRHFLYEEESPVPGMIDACRRLQQYPVDLIAIPCNSAQAWYPEVQTEIDLPILNIVETTVQSIRERLPLVSAIVVFGGRVTWARRTYAACARRYGLEYCDVNEETQMKVESLIERIKVQEDLPNVVAEVESIASDVLRDHEHATIILGCTEFGCIVDKITGFRWVDSATEYARQIVNISGYRLLYE